MNINRLRRITIVTDRRADGQNYDSDSVRLATRTKMVQKHLKV